MSRWFRTLPIIISHLCCICIIGGIETTFFSYLQPLHLLKIYRLKFIIFMPKRGAYA